MGVRAPPAVVSQVTSSQAIDIIDETEMIPDTEMSYHIDDDRTESSANVRPDVDDYEATQPSTLPLMLSSNPRHD